MKSKFLRGEIVKKIFTVLYDISYVAWVVGVFITCFCGNVVPMWISLVAMNVFVVLKNITWRQKCKKNQND